MRKIFINYRRAEAEYAAGALGRDLRRHFGDDKVFRDKEDIAGGASWKRRVLDEINGQSALLILIGRDWANVTDAQGRRRLDNPDDPLRLEIADGLRDGAAILPILLENAEMPAEPELPEDLRSITEHNALRLRDSDWQYDLNNICATLERAGFEAIASPRQTTTAPSPPKVSISARVIGAAVLAGFGGIAAAIGMNSAPAASRVIEPAVVQPTDTPRNPVQPVASRVAVELRRERVPDNRDSAVSGHPALDRPTNQPDRVSSVVATSITTTDPSEPKSESLRDILLGAWHYQVDQPIEGGRLRGTFTDQFLRNGASTSVGRVSIITRLPDGTPFEITWQCNATGEWLLDGRNLTEKLIDLKSFVSDVKINAQSVDVATVQRNMNQMGQSLPSLESLLPQGLSTESQILAADPTEMTLRTPDDAGGFRTTVYRKATLNR